MLINHMKMFDIFCSHFSKNRVMTGNITGNMSYRFSDGLPDVPTYVPISLTKWEQSSPCGTRVVPVVPSVPTQGNIQGAYVTGRLKVRLMDDQMELEVWRVFEQCRVAHRISNMSH
jgi:hypothetical protein